MPTIATAFAETTKRSKTFADLSKRTLRLYRNYLRHAPTFVELYELDMPTATIRTKIRQEFERHRFEKNLDVSNVLYAKGQMEFQELVNFWKQNAHVMRYFANHGDTNTFEVKGTKSEFLDKFLSGR